MLKNKRVLFLAPKFYQYHSEIISSLELKGASVTFYQEMNYSLSYRIFSKFSIKIERLFKKKYMKNILKDITFDMYDIVFIIRGGSLDKNSLESLHLKLPQAKFFMYQWDSTRQNDYLSLLSYFDKVQTFDMVDSKTYNIDYLPLFYTSVYRDFQKREFLYDLVFFGAYHSDRLKIIKHIDILFQENDLSFKYHLYITKLALFRFVLQGTISLKDLKYFKTYSISTKDIIESYQHSNSVLDIELSIQNGLTIRTFETLGSGLKLVTTNDKIKEEDFYNPDRILVINRDILDVNLNFFKQKKDENVIFSQFYIDSWLDNIFTFNNG